MLTPETIKILDPACGSGHILVEAYDVLKAIYEEQGYEPKAIPRLILEKNLYGLDIDDRAAQLAAFALMMKARADDRRIFANPPKLNILSLQSTEKLNLAQLWHKLDLYKEGTIGATSSLFEEPQLNLTDEINRQEYKMLAEILRLFAHAKTFGSLIQIPANYEKPLADLLAQLENLVIHGDTFQTNAAKTLQPYLQQAHILAMQFDAVIANPPYMGGKGMNPALKDFAKKHFPDSKSDLFAMFIERGFGWCKASGFNAQVTMQSWMFLSSYQAMREKLLSSKTLNTMAHTGARAFSEISGEVVQTTAFVFHGDYFSGYKPAFFRLVDGNEEQKQTALLIGQNRFDKTVQDDFKKISGSPVAYWVSDKVRKVFDNYPTLSTLYPVKSGIMTGNDPLFLKLWFEVDFLKIGFNLESSQKMDSYWYPISKGGDYRKWCGNNEHVINLRDDGYDIKNSGGNFRLREKKWYFKPYVTWSRISSSQIAFRILEKGILFADAAPAIFAENNCFEVISFLNSKISNYLLEGMNPTLNFQINDIESLPLININVTTSIREIFSISKTDWNNYETSWDFTENPLIRQKQNTQQGLTVRPELVEGGTVKPLMVRQAHHERLNLNTIEQCFNQWQTQNRAAIDEMKRLEEENNRLFIDAYGLQDELTPDVPEEQITLVRADREKDCRDFISYAVGCLFGRYSLDKTGLILASQGETLDDYLKQIPEPTLMPCENNVLPIIDGDWFADDVSERFREFLRVSFGEAHYAENLHFIEESLGKKIGQYFVKDFYSDHIKRYKKRPIYWLFSSPKGSFNALIYLHRYRPDTVSVVLNDYLREFRTKLTAHKTHLEAISIRANATQSEKTKALKEIEKFKKILLELETYEREVLYPLATQQIDIDLDDGVKANYPKFGAALKKIPGLDRVEE
ncbi:MAG: BREX-1 system adenine-specific DNA-methyltransferase PglX [Methylovulum sp.]|nr:BREX-1 system adenine-specific DNA-methyltransferase PglX [Methylovulum sp.]